jgi:hypothetical protein
MKKLALAVFLTSLGTVWGQQTPPAAAVGTGLPQPAPATAQVKTAREYNGYWWNDTSQTFKLGFVSGYILALSPLFDVMGLKCAMDAQRKRGLPPDQYPGDEVLKSCIQSPEVAVYDFTNLRFGQLLEGVDEFYKDFRNKGVDIDFAMGYVRDELKGKSPDKLEGGLKRARAASK